MKNKLFLALFLNLLTIFTFAQTKLIHHKSHSGNAKNFLVALENNLFDIGESNFGMVPMKMVKTAELDSLIFLSDTSTIMVTKEVCRNEFVKKADPEIWKAGRDTVYNHALFTLRYELDSIKKTLDELYNFQNPVKDMTFVGYANERPKPSQQPSPKLDKISKKELKKHKKKIKEKQKAKKKFKKKKKDRNQELTIAPIGINHTPTAGGLMSMSIAFFMCLIAALSLLRNVEQIKLLS